MVFLEIVFIFSFLLIDYFVFQIINFAFGGEAKKEGEIFVIELISGISSIVNIAGILFGFLAMIECKEPNFIIFWNLVKAIIF